MASSRRQETLARYRERNPEAIREAAARYREKNREKIRAYNREYQARLREDPAYQQHQRDLMTATQRADPDRASEIRRRSYEKHAEKRRAERRASYRVDRAEIYERGKGRCHICKEHVDSDSFEVDHIIPRKFGGSDDASNLAISHRACNRKKATKMLGWSLA